MPGSGGLWLSLMIEQRTTPWHQAARPGRRLGHTVEAYASIGSTSDRVLDLLDDASGEGIVVVAEHQTAGRGRMGRRWTSPAGLNLTASVGFRPMLAASDAWQLGLAAALAVHAACAAAAPVELKWPNDLVSRDGRKLGGLLVETTTEGEWLRTAVLGFGINVNWRHAEMPPELASRATSLAEAAGRAVDRIVLLQSVLEHLDGELAVLETGRSPLERYRAACRTLGANVSVDTPGGRLEGRALDLDERGSLVVETAGGLIAVSSGEVVRVQPGTRA